MTIDKPLEQTEYAPWIFAITAGLITIGTLFSHASDSAIQGANSVAMALAGAAGGATMGKSRTTTVVNP